MSNLDGLAFYGNPSLEESVLQNLISFFKWGLLEIGGFYTIATGQLNYLGQDESRLRPLFATGSQNYTIYRGVKHDWVWEQNINLKYSSGSQPVLPSSILINGALTSTGYYADYSRGQIVFTNPRSSGDIVQAPHTLRAVQIYPYEGEEYRQLAYGWQNQSANTSGIYDYAYKAYLPAIFINIADNTTDRGLELGSRAKLSRFELEFHIFSANAYERRKLMDLCNMLEEKSITLYDIKNVPKPLNSAGQLINPSSTYPLISTVYGTGMGWFDQDANSFKASNIKVPLNYGRVTLSLLVESYPI
jgi:hypothetical protein